MNAASTNCSILVGVLFAVLALLVTLARRKPWALSVAFLGWKRIPPRTAGEVAAIEIRYGLRGATHEFRTGDCALLAVTNNDTRELRFETLAVEYKTDAGWIEVVPKQWRWFSGWAWRPGTGSTLSVPRPTEVPSSTPWRIRFVCHLDGETDVGQGIRASGLRTQLNRFAQRLLGRKTLLFYHPVEMVTPDIPPMDCNRGEAK